MLLAGDIGGTKTELALYTAEGGPRAPHAQARFPSANYSGLSAIIHEFLATTGASVEAACLAVAGPVVAGQAKITNLPWVMSEADLGHEFGLRDVHLLNDLEAIAWAVPTLGPADLTTLNTGAPIARGAIGVIAPGTGLGEAFLTWMARPTVPTPRKAATPISPPPTRCKLACWPSCSEKLTTSATSISARVLACPPSIITRQRPCARSARAGRRAGQRGRPYPGHRGRRNGPRGTRPAVSGYVGSVVAVLGAEAGNLALKVLATGGVYVAGGIPPRIAPLLEDGRFMGPFQRKGRFAALLAAMPVYVITSNAALLGAAHHGLQLAAD